MQLVRFVPRNDLAAPPRWAVVDGDLDAGQAFLNVVAGDPLTGGASTSERLELSAARLLAPATPSKIIGVGLNYRAHAEEMKKPLPDEPLLFMKPPSALIGPGEAIERPEGYQRTDYEGEICLCIGRLARRVSRERALEHVFGVTCMNDVTVRDLQKKDVQYTRAKGFDSFAPCGPALTTLDAFDPRAIRVRSWLNDEPRQDSTSADLIFDLATLVSFISHVMTLLPGDLITTGTPPGVGPIAPGDRVRIHIDGVGTLVNPVVRPPEPQGVA